LGAFKLKPGDLYEYTIEEYLLCRQGHYDSIDLVQRAHYNNARLICYYVILPHLSKSDQKKPVDKIVPDNWGGKQVVSKTLKDIFNERQQLLKQADARRKAKGEIKKKKKNG